MLWNGNQLTRIEKQIGETSSGIHKRLDRHEDKQDKCMDRIEKKLEKCPKEDMIETHDDDIKCLKSWTSGIIWKVVLGIISLGTFGAVMYKVFFR